jgi:hypothetical protein
LHAAPDLVVVQLRHVGLGPHHSELLQRHFDPSVDPGNGVALFFDLSIHLLKLALPFTKQGAVLALSVGPSWRNYVSRITRPERLGVVDQLIGQTLWIAAGWPRQRAASG